MYRYANPCPFMRRYFSFGPVVEFVRKDAEIAIDMDGIREQFTVSRHHKTVEEAEKAADAFCKQLHDKVVDLIKAETANLKRAKE